jgi:endonuclease YncB( thermonuclease family)
MRYEYAATITRVVDADTVVASLDLGFSFWWHDVRWRLAHIDAPELRTPEGQVARTALLNLLGPLPAQVTMQTLKDRTDDYGRYLAEILTAEGVNVNQTLLAQGYAKPWPAPKGSTP